MTNITTTPVRISLAIIAASLLFSVNTVDVAAIGYGGVGGRPAFPDENIPRSKSIFIHTLEPGASTTDAVEVVNTSDKTVTVKVYTADSTPSTDGGFACRQFGEDKVIASWIELESEKVILPPKENKIIPFTIKLPASADVGEHNACILMQAEKNKGSGGAGISLSVRTGIRVAITVPGELIREIEIVDLIIERRGDDTWVFSPVVSNSGNVTVDTTMTLNTRSIFGGGHQKFETVFPVLRDDNARWNFEVNPFFWGGWYLVSLDVHYESTAGEKINLTGPTIRFFAPPQPIALVIYSFILFVLILIGLTIVFFRRRAKWIKNEWVVGTVKSGDTLESLSKRHGVSWKLITKVNNIKPPYDITGLKVKLPPIGSSSRKKRPTKKPVKKVINKPVKKTTKKSSQKKPPKK